MLREAVRLVEHHQVARMRRGPNGGLIVCAPDAGPATRAVVIYLEYRGTTLDDLLDARLVLEPLAAALAAEQIDEAGIERLRAVLSAEQQRPGLPAARDEFHVALAQQSKNPVLQLFIEVSMRLTRRFALSSRTDSATEALEALDRLHDDHSGIAAAVTAGDSARAKALSERHVQAVTAWLQQHRRGDRSGRARPDRYGGWTPRRPRQAGRSAGRRDRRRYRRQRLAGRRGFRNRGCAAGTLSREPCGAAGSGTAAGIPHDRPHAPGPGGGLVVTRPQAQASIDTIALYLQYRKPSREDLGRVGDAIEIANVAKVVQLRNEPEVAAMLDTLNPSMDFAAGEAAGEMRKAAAEEFRFHIGLAQLAGNALLDLFLRIIGELVRRHWSSTGGQPPAAADVVAVEHAHLRILQAIRAGDDSLARYRIRRHLDAATTWWL
ncbi:FCD domain protein [Mycobacterium kansasii]|uniref:FCD domain protein n=1 Tax=Mycobacterium kansasii TaxID=1768 RepID=A0A1V3XTK3_MYCKA|nr:FCD domain protein [Mycobacterium kansasii]